MSKTVMVSLLIPLLDIDPTHVFMTGRFMGNYGIYGLLLLNISDHVLQCDTADMGPTNECVSKRKQKQPEKQARREQTVSVS